MDDIIWIASAEYPGLSPYLILEYALQSSSDDNLLSPPILKASPNPFRESLNLDLGGKTTLPGRIGIYNLRGQRVRSLTLPAGSNNISWNGEDDSGRMAMPGIYLIRLFRGARIEQIKVLKLK